MLLEGARGVCLPIVEKGLKYCCAFFLCLAIILDNFCLKILIVENFVFNLRTLLDILKATSCLD